MRSETPSNRNQLSLRRTTLSQAAPYEAVFGDVSKIIDAARESATRSVNAAMTAAYWLIGRRIVEFEQSGEDRAEYGAALMEKLAEDLTGRFGRGFSLQSIYKMRLFYLSFPPDRIRQTPSGISEATPVEVGLDDLMTAFPLPWSAYERLLSVRDESAREFYEREALRGGWSVRQLDRQIGSQFYERTALSKNNAAMLSQGQKPKTEDLAVPQEQILITSLSESKNLCQAQLISPVSVYRLHLSRRVVCGSTYESPVYAWCSSVRVSRWLAYK